MDWSATLSLTTSHAPQHRANYGSFSSSSSLKRISSSTTISIPQSIPENQCVVQFSSPRLPRAKLQVMEHYDTVDAKRSIAGTSVMTITETTRLTTFKMLLTNPHASSVLKQLDGGEAPHITTNTEQLTEEGTVSSYWLQERERMRLQRDRRYLQRNGSPTKAATLRDEDDPETSRYKTAAILCSVPLVLVLVFVVVMLVFGDGSDVASAVSPDLLNTAAAPSPVSSAAFSSVDATSSGRLRGVQAVRAAAATTTAPQNLDLRPPTTTPTT